MRAFVVVNAAREPHESRNRQPRDDGAVYEFAPKMEPVRTVESGTILTIETRDSLEYVSTPF